MSSGFDYPLPLFYVSKFLPEHLFSNPSFLAFLSGASFLTCVYLLVIGSQAKFNLIEAISILLIFLSYPTRYMLERGQLDTLNWTIAIAAVLILIPRKHSAEDITKEELNVISNLRICISSLALFLSTLVKGFTLPALLVWSIYLYRSNKRTPALLGVLLTAISTFIILGPLARIPGAHATYIQVEPGEIFGYSVGIFSLADYVIKILFITVGSVFGFSFNNNSRYSPSLSLLTIVSTSTYLAFYFLSVSANYKLVCTSLVLYAIVRSNLASASRRSTPTTVGLTPLYSIPVIISLASVLIFNYRPYIPEIQFLSQALFDNVLMPTTVGFAAVYLLSVLFTPDRKSSLSL